MSDVLHESALFGGFERREIENPHPLALYWKSQGVVIPKEVSFYETVGTLTARAACVYGTCCKRIIHAGLGRFVFSGFP